MRISLNTKNVDKNSTNTNNFFTNHNLFSAVIHSRERNEQDLYTRINVEIKNQEFVDKKLTTNLCKHKNAIKASTLFVVA